MFSKICQIMGGAAVWGQRRNMMRYVSGEGIRGTPGKCIVDLGNKECAGGFELIVYIP